MSSTQATPGTSIGTYRLVEKLEGQGTEVFIAERQGERFVLALFELGVETASALTPEIERCRALAHENVTSALDVFEHDGRQVFVFEGMEGATLARLLAHPAARNERLSDAAALAIGLGMCRGLAAAHTARDADDKVVPLVHAQLGPPQIFVSWEGEVKLLGIGLSTLFGLARAAGMPSSASMRYAPPEVRSSGAVTVRGNVYSAAAILWELLVGREPPEDGIPSLRAERPDLDEQLTAIIDKALHPLLVKRAVGAADIARAIERTGLADRGALSRELDRFDEIDRRSTIGPDSFPPAALSGPPPVIVPPHDPPMRAPAIEPAKAASKTELMSRDELVAASEREVSDATPEPGTAPTTHLMSRQELIEAALREAAAGARPASPKHSDTQVSKAGDAATESAGPKVVKKVEAAATAKRAGRSRKRRRPRTDGRRAAEPVVALGTPRATKPSASKDSTQDGSGEIPWSKIAAVTVTIASAFAVGFLVAHDWSGPPPDATPSPVDTAAQAEPLSPPPEAMPASSRPTIPPAEPTATAAPSPEDAPVPTPETTVLRIETSQPNAQVYVDGKARGPANAPIEVPCGVHSIRIGDQPLTRWMSNDKAFSLPCGGHERLMLEPWYAGKQTADPEPEPAQKP